MLNFADEKKNSSKKKLTHNNKNKLTHNCEKTY